MFIFGAPLMASASRGARRLGEAVGLADALVWNVAVEAGADRAVDLVRLEASVLGLVEDPRPPRRGFVCEPAHLRDRHGGHGTVGHGVDLEVVAVLLAVRLALDDLLAGHPLLERQLAAGAVRRGAPEDREAVDDDVLVELLVGDRVAPRPAPLDD
jgi:hypothetical protein